MIMEPGKEYSEEMSLCALATWSGKMGMVCSHCVCVCESVCVCVCVCVCVKKYDNSSLLRFSRVGEWQALIGCVYTLCCIAVVTRSLAEACWFMLE